MALRSGQGNLVRISAQSGLAEAAGRAGWSRTCALLASTSVAALLIGIGTPPALAACPTTITGNAPACANRVTITRIAVTAATVSGSIFNTGTISPNGITIDNQSTISGSVIDRGLLITDKAVVD